MKCCEQIVRPRLEILILYVENNTILQNLSLSLDRFLPIRMIMKYLIFTIFSLLYSTILHTSESEYHDIVIKGWRILIDTSVERDTPKELEVTLRLLREKLKQVEIRVPQHKLILLKQTTIWINNQTGIGMSYHDSAKWLKNHGRNPKMAHSIEMRNISDFNRRKDTHPMALMHELAHGLHDKLGFDNQDVIKAYENAIKNKLYFDVTRYDGFRGKAYALTDHREYFAELTEAFFGKNDWYPVTKSELKIYDPVGYQLMEKYWE